MIKCKTYGRMGNFLFQVATTISYALDKGQEFTIPDSTADPFSNPLYLQHLVNRRWNPNRESVLVTEDGHCYQEIPWKREWSTKNVILDGYWQSEKYFAHYRQEILNLFGYHWEPYHGVVSVHVRRGDYVRLIHKHPPVPPEWYRRCMAEFTGYRFLFFSDDIEWCIKEFGDDPNVQFSSHQPIEWDLMKMSCCEHHISSASTFSWWGAWLNRNPNKRVLIPKQWFTAKEEARCCTKDIVPPDWERI